MKISQMIRPLHTISRSSRHYFVCTKQHPGTKLVSRKHVPFEKNYLKNSRELNKLNSKYSNDPYFTFNICCSLLTRAKKIKMGRYTL